MQRDVQSLRSLLISVLGEDDEGAYRPSFVRDFHAASTERPTERFRGARAFLNDLAAL